MLKCKVKYGHYDLPLLVWAEHGGKTKNYRVVMNSMARGKRSCLWQPDFSSFY